jgi:hypothetical protein
VARPRLKDFKAMGAETCPESKSVVPGLALAVECLAVGRFGQTPNMGK